MVHVTQGFSSCYIMWVPVIDVHFSVLQLKWLQDFQIFPTEDTPTPPGLLNFGRLEILINLTYQPKKGMKILQRRSFVTFQDTSSWRYICVEIYHLGKTSAKDVVFCSHLHCSQGLFFFHPTPVLQERCTKIHHTLSPIIMEVENGCER